MQTRILKLIYLFNVIYLVNFHIVSGLKVSVELRIWDLQEEELQYGKLDQRKEWSTEYLDELIPGADR